MHSLIHAIITAVLGTKLRLMGTWFLLRSKNGVSQLLRGLHDACAQRYNSAVGADQVQRHRETRLEEAMESGESISVFGMLPPVVDLQQTTRCMLATTENLDGWTILLCCVLLQYQSNLALRHGESAQ
eukprot:SAG31_NODE_651_length_13184_cov_4.999541_5_plen_128_part_00